MNIKQTLGVADSRQQATDGIALLVPRPPTIDGQACANAISPRYDTILVQLFV